jgi:hypothetical protein
MDTFNEKQIMTMNKYDPKELKKNRGLQPINETVIHNKLPQLSQ